MEIQPIKILWPKFNLEKTYSFHCVMGDTIVWTFVIVGLNLTGYAIRGELYDLNTSIRMANDVAGSISAPEIVITEASDEYSIFTATVDVGLTATMQQYSQIEFAIWQDYSGPKTTIFQQPIRFTFERIIWTKENEPVFEQDNQDNLQWCIGITTVSAAAGANITIRTIGEITIDSASFNIGRPVYVRDLGILTQDESLISTSLVNVGIATSTTTMVIDIQEPIDLI